MCILKTYGASSIFMLSAASSFGRCNAPNGVFAMSIKPLIVDWKGLKRMGWCFSRAHTWRLMFDADYAVTRFQRVESWESIATRIRCGVSPRCWLTLKPTVFRSLKIGMLLKEQEPGVKPGSFHFSRKRSDISLMNVRVLEIQPKLFHSRRNVTKVLLFRLPSERSLGDSVKGHNLSGIRFRWKAQYQSPPSPYPSLEIHHAHRFR